VLGPEWHERVDALTHMQFVSGSWRAVELRVLRASFSGELAFELHCRTSITTSLWEALIATGLAPYGLEALDILRLEKGYLVGAELNGQTSPLDLNMDALLKLDNPCIGRALLERPAFHEADRWRLVGVQASDASAKFLAGAQLAAIDAPARSLGHITSAVYSPTLQRWVGLALVAQNATDKRLLARDPLRGLETKVVTTSPVHFDAAGERMKA